MFRILMPVYDIFHNATTFICCNMEIMEEYQSHNYVVILTQRFVRIYVYVDMTLILILLSI